MRRVSLVARFLAMVVVAGLITNCGDSPTDPTKVERPSLATASNGSGLSITTDKDDYAPGDTVWFTGAGWTPGDTLDIVLTDSTDVHNWRVPIDENGGFRDSTYVVDTGDLGVTFTLTATSRTNPEQTLTVTFTDAVVLRNTATFTPASPTTGGTFSVGLTADFNGQGGTWKGTEWSIDLGPTTCVNTADFVIVLSPPATDNRSVTLLGLVAPTTAGPHTLHVQLYSADNCLPNSGPGSAKVGGLKDYAFTVASPADASAPVVTNVAATPNPANGTAAVTLTADVSDATTGNSTIKSAEYKIDAGSWTAMSASDGAFDEATEPVTAMIAASVISDLADGNHSLCVRATDALDNTSDGTACTTLLVDKTAPVVSNVSATPNPGNTGNATLTATATDALTNVTSAEYKVDAGSWIGMSAQDGAFDSKTEAVTASLSGLAEGSHQVCVRATDAVNNTSDGTDCITLIVDQTPPVVSNVSASPNPVNSGSVTVTALAVDALTNVTAAAFTIDGGSDNAMSAQDGAFDSKSETVTGTILSATIAGLTEGSHSVCVKATDAVSNTSDGTACTTLVVDRTPPAISGFTITPNPVPAGTSFTVSFTLTDALSNIKEADYSYDNGGGRSWYKIGGPYGTKTVTVSATVSTTTPDVIEICVRGTDAADNTNQIGATTNPVECQLVAVYDPSAGFVTGGGWIMSPTGAYLGDPSLYGKATFGFVSKYVKGKTTPTGNTEFQFHVAKFNFSSTSYDWLVVSGYRAQYKGYGTVNGQGNYGFLLTAIDGNISGSPTADAFRIKIWDVATSAIVYDNQLGQSDTGDATTQISSGSIMIQSGKK